MASSLQEEAEGSGKKEITRWTPRMEEAYLAALDKVGGLEAAKPRAILDELQHEFPQLTLQACKWHLLAHRRRVERHKVMQPQGIAPPTKWTGRLEAAYEAAVAQLGGLASATPKPVYEALQDEFPELTLQHVKTHMQKQRRKEQRSGGQQASEGAAMQRQESAALERGQSSEPPQRPASAAAATAAAAAAFVGASPAEPATMPLAAAAATFPAAASSELGCRPQEAQRMQQHAQQQAQHWQAGPEQQPRLVSSSALQAEPQALAAQRPAGEAAGEMSLVQQARLMLQAAGLQLPGSEPLVGEPTDEDLQRAAAVQHAVQALGPRLLPAAQQAQLAQQAQQPQQPLSEQQVQHVAALLLAELVPAAGLASTQQMPPPPPQYVPRFVHSPVPQAWHAQLLPAAQHAQLIASRQALHCRQCVVQLERQAEQLVELLQSLRQSQGGSSSGGAATEMSAGTTLAAQSAAQQVQHAGVPLGAIPFHLHKLVKRLVTRSSPVSSGKAATTHAVSRQQRHAARIVSAFTVISGKELQAQQAQHAQQVQHPHQPQQGQHPYQPQQGQQAQRPQQGQQGQQMEVDQPGPPVPPPPGPGEWRRAHNPVTCVIPGCPACMFQGQRGTRASDGVLSG